MTTTPAMHACPARPAHTSPSRTAAPDRHPPLRRGRGARRRRPLGGALHLDPAAPRGRLGRLLPLRPTARPVRGAKTLVLGAHHSIADAPALDVLIHPGGPGTRPMLHDRGHLDWVRGSATTVPLMTSVCTGSLVYAAAGLLVGRRATTHWASLNLLSELDPTIITDVDATFRRRRRPDHQRRSQRRHRHGAAPRGPAHRRRARPRGPPRDPVRPHAPHLTRLTRQPRPSDWGEPGLDVRA